MFVKPYRREEWWVTTAVSQDFLVLGINHYLEQLKILAVDENHSPEGDEWDFIYDGRLNRLYLEKRDERFVFSGDLSADVLAGLKELFGPSTLRQAQCGAGLRDHKEQ
jgi:hypothetical protein